MARHKEFDPDVALDTAMRVFWRSGYAHTSTEDLVTELGIARASLYGTYGSKRGLYLAALDRYLTGGGDPAQVVASAASGLDAVRALLESAARQPDQGLPPGCFSVNATVEHGDTDPEIGARLERNRERMETVFRDALLRARAEGDLDTRLCDDSEISSTATLLTTVLNGLQVLSRAGADQRGRIARTVEAALAGLRAR